MKLLGKIYTRGYFINDSFPLLEIYSFLERLQPSRVIRAWLPLSIRIQVESGNKNVVPKKEFA